MENEPGHCATFGQNKATALTKDEAETYEPSVAKTSKLIGRGGHSCFVAGECTLEMTSRRIFSNYQT